MICMEFVLCSPENQNIKFLYNNQKIQKHNNVSYARHEKMAKCQENNRF